VKLVSPSSHTFAHYTLNDYSNLVRISFSLLFLLLLEEKLFLHSSFNRCVLKVHFIRSQQMSL
jgi:hypothetical protein